MPIDASTTLADLVIEDPRRARVLEGLGLDYCCNGQQLLADATAGAGLDLAEVAASMTFTDTAPMPAAASGQAATLAHEVVDTHHAYMWEEMPRLQALVDKVHRVHGANHPELGAVREAYTGAVGALDPHMTREERSVFPAISRLEKSGTAAHALPATLDELVAEHVVVGDLFRRINELTNGYAPPVDACASYRAMLAGLQEMELDLHEHIHKENNILFPAARALSAPRP